jgi:hypothetical protein
MLSVILVAAFLCLVMVLPYLPGRFDASAATFSFVGTRVSSGTQFLSTTLVAEGYNWYPRWSPDGRWLVYTAIAPGDDKKNIDIFAVPVAGDAKPILLVGGSLREVEGSWRPK